MSPVTTRRKGTTARDCEVRNKQMNKLKESTKPFMSVKLDLNLELIIIFVIE